MATSILLLLVPGRCRTAHIASLGPEARITLDGFDSGVNNDTPNLTLPAKGVSRIPFGSGVYTADIRRCF
jgi:hypothetical protein